MLFRHFQLTFISCVFCVAVTDIRCVDGVHLTAYLSQNGLHGSVSFEHQGKTDPTAVNIRISLQSVEEYSEWSWSVRELPVRYDLLHDRCSDDKLGNIFLKIDDIFGRLTLPLNSSSEIVTSVNLIPITGTKGLWGKSLVLESMDGTQRRACGTIVVSGKADEKVAEARFFSPLAGSVFFQWIGSHHSDSTDTLVYSDLYHIVNQNYSTTNDWKIFTTDILDTEADKARENCDFLQVVYNEASSSSEEKVGDLGSRVGKLKISNNPQISSTNVYHDDGLTSLTVDILDGPRSLYLVVFDSKHHDSFIACAKIRQVQPVFLKAVISSHGVKGEVTLAQKSRFHPTWIDMNLTSSDKLLQQSSILTAYRIHTLPPQPEMLQNNDCDNMGQMYNPQNINLDEASGSQDTYAVGDLSGKHNMWRKGQTLSEVSNKYWDIYLPTQGPYSVAHRSIVFYKEAELSNTPNINPDIGMPWICSSFSHYAYSNKNWKVPMFTAEVVFRYPIVGRILFRQPTGQSWSDTAVIIEYLIHADGTSQNNTFEHRWKVHDLAPGKDFYDWQNRCLSAGQTYNPYKVPNDKETSKEYCSLTSPSYCCVGDLSARHSTLAIAGRKVNGIRLTRMMYIDTQLPLSGSASIVGHSVVLYDDHGPKARGERLACSLIVGVYRRKAVVKDWFGNGQPTSVTGKIEFYQQTEYDLTDMEVELEGLVDNSGYHVHVVPVEANLEFPCEESSLYGHWNPLGVNPTTSPPSSEGSTDQYEMGDLSGKFGTLDKLRSINAVFNDTRLPLFGPNSILGRSVIIHKKDRNKRWACSTIERGYAPSEARELRAIASFHHPLGYAYGYIRMTQLVYNDGSKSDTVIEVKLRHPGKHDRNVTRNHNWAIYVNPVGVDASVKILNTRCVAGGYVWNPYYTQLADPRNEDLYNQECGPDNPLRCYVGDVSGRLGTIDIGDKRQVFTDINFPLEGDQSALGRSIVILNKDRGSERFACANIEPDKDIIKYANIEKPPKFVLAQFLDDVREVMGIPEWMLSVDSRKTKILHTGTCIQFLLHFKGPIANQLEQDFSRLLSSGQLAQPSLYIHGYVPSKKKKTHLSYRPCGSKDPSDRSYKSRAEIHKPKSLSMLFLLLSLNIYL